MAGRGDIKAGAAFVELFLKNRMTPALTKALLGAKKQLNGMASAARFVGGTLNQLSGIAFKVGAGITTPFIAALGHLKQGQHIFGQIGKMLANALGKPLLPILRDVRAVVKQFSLWAKQNPELIRTVFKIGVGITALSFALKAAGSAALVVAAGLAASATFMGALAAAVAVIGTPLGAVVIALAAGVAAWARWTDSGKAATSFLMNRLRQFGRFFGEIIGGMKDAIIGGDLQLAAKIAMDGINVALQFLRVQAVALWGGVKLAAVTAWEDIKMSVLNVFDEISISGRTAIAFLGSLWNAFSLMVAVAFPTAIALASKAWAAFQLAGTLAMQGLIDLANKLSTALGVAVGVMGVAVNQSRAGAAARLATDTAVEGFKASDIGEIIGNAAAAASAEAEKARNELAGPKMEREAGRAGRIDAAAGNLAAQVAEAQAALDAARVALDVDREKAAAKAAAFASGMGLDLGGDKPTVTFSGAGLLAAGQGGGGPMQEIVKHAKKQVEKLDVIHQDLIKLKDKKPPTFE